MADIFHDFPVNASSDKVFQAISTAAGLAAWWTKRSSGEPALESEYQLWFGPEYDWRAAVTKCVPDVEFELKLTKAMEDWLGTLVGFLLKESDGTTQVSFYHTGWPEANDHYRGSSFCWALYLRLLKRYIENNEVVAYEDRDKA